MIQKYHRNRKTPYPVPTACCAAPQGEDEQHVRTRRHGSGAANVVSDVHWTWRVVLPRKGKTNSTSGRRGVAALCLTSTGHGALCCLPGKINSTSRRGDRRRRHSAWQKRRRSVITSENRRCAAPCSMRLSVA